MKKYFIWAIAIILAFLLVKFIAYVVLIVIVTILAGIIYFLLKNWLDKANQ